MVLCSVRSVEGALKEIHRILVPVINDYMGQLFLE
jgi:hypothetical protein